MTPYADSKVISAQAWPRPDTFIQPHILCGVMALD